MDHKPIGYEIVPLVYLEVIDHHLLWLNLLNFLHLVPVDICLG